MKFIPILFSTPMVQAILDGRKTMTRRIMKPQPHESIRDIRLGFSALTPKDGIELRGKFIVDGEERYGSKFLKLKYGVGEILWVRETFRYSDALNAYGYKIGEIKMGSKSEIHTPIDKIDGLKWKPSLFMPKDACRIFLEITSIKAEKLQDISEEDAIKEGIRSSHPEHSFYELWEKINGPGSWEANPFVWCVSFKRIDKPDSF